MNECCVEKITFTIKRIATIGAACTWTRNRTTNSADIDLKGVYVTAIICFWTVVLAAQ
jgi:hypothetical protein